MSFLIPKEKEFDLKDYQINYISVYTNKDMSEAFQHFLKLGTLIFN
jgi:hypothetical protein